MDMNDKELADAVVALGVGAKSGEYCYSLEGIPHCGITGYPVYSFVRDWRVAGKMIEKVDAVYVEALFGGGCFQVQVMMDCESTDWHEDLSTPRAIIEACVEVLK